MFRDSTIDRPYLWTAGVLAVAMLAASCASSTPTAEGTGQALPLADSINEPGVNEPGVNEPGVNEPEIDEPGDDDADSQSAADRIGCSAEGALDGVIIRWWELPAGVGLSILADGVEVADAGRAAPADTFSLFGAADEPGALYEVQLTASGLDPLIITCGQAGRLTTIPAPTCSIELVGGKPQLTLTFPDGGFGPINRTAVRDGVPVEAAFLGNANPVDIGAVPGETYTYQVEVGDNSGRPAAVAECGTVTVPIPSGREAELTAAKELFHGRAFGPYIYFDATFDGELVSLYMEPGSEGVRAIKPPLGDDTLRDPFAVHDDLAAAIERGQDVDYQLDSVSGLPLWWIVDDVVGKFHCIEADTAPPEIRTRPCDATRDLMGL